MGSVKTIVLSACSVVLFGAAISARASAPLVSYSFPASWAGTGTTATDLSGNGNNGVEASTPALSTTLPPGVTAGTDSLMTNTGGFYTKNLELLSNATVAAAGGFEYDVDFMWDGTGGAVQKIIDYAGTEYLQLESVTDGTGTTGTASLHFGLNDDGETPATETTPHMSISSGNWYQVDAIFNSAGNSIDGSGTIAGLATLTVTDLTTSGSPVVVGPLAATKTNEGDGLDRPIGFGQFGYVNASALVKFDGLIYNPTVSLLPEPASLSLIGMAAVTMLRRRRA